MKIVLVSHGSYSKGLLESVQMLVGEQENLVAYGLYPEQELTTLTQKLEDEIKNTIPEEILFITDIFHGSPFNSVVSLMEKYDVGHLTGINLPLLLETIMKRNSGYDVDRICKEVVEMESETIKDVKKCIFGEGE